MKPSETERGQAWLTNFASQDVTFARLLLDSLYIPSTDDIRQSIKTILQALEDTRPGVLLPVQSAEDITETRKRNEADPLDEELNRPQTAYVDFHPGSDISPTPGSEGMVGNVIRELTGSKPERHKSGWFHPRTSIETLREHRCRTFVLVTDYAGSGRQVTQYAKTLTRNSTIRSWRSLRYIRIFAVMHSASSEAVKAMQSSPDIDDYLLAEHAPSFATAHWTSEERAEIERVCRLYAPGSQALGFRGSAGLLAMHSGVPNNLPKVIRELGGDWKPFFDGRTFPRDLAAALPSYRPHRNLATVAEEHQQARLARVVDSGRLGTTASQIAAALVLINRQGCNTEALASALGVTGQKAADIWRFLETAGMISGSSLTQRGTRELMAAKAMPRKTRVSLTALNKEPYYPQSLR